MSTKRRRQTRARNWSPTVYDPARHNYDAAMRKRIRRANRALRGAALAMRRLAHAIQASGAAFDAFAAAVTPSEDHR